MSSPQRFELVAQILVVEPVDILEKMSFHLGTGSHFRHSY